MITKAGSALALLLLFQALVLGQERPGIPEVKKVGPGISVLVLAASTDQDAPSPSVEIKGPTTRPAGRTAVLKIAASGKDLKVACFPANDEWFLVQFVGKTEVGILFETDKEGVYSFAVAANDGGKTAVAVHVITIGTPPPPTPPPPTPVVDKLAKAIQDAYTRDIATDRGNKVMREKLRDAYVQGAKQFIPGAKSNIELMTNQGQLNTGLIGAASVGLPQVRLEIGAAVTEVLGNNSNAMLDTAKATELWNKIAQALDKATP